MKFAVPKKHILKPTLSTYMVQRGLRCRGKRGAMVENAKAHGIEILLFNLMNTNLVNGFWKIKDEDKTRQKNGQT